ncbi:MAG: Crp/Fnr family transcriptional regulator [Rhodospirillales bacterium]|nr:Crp/Fnr family transcriptional regulator [Rhodospirillales bacterium]
MPGHRGASPRLAIAARPFLSGPATDGARRDLLTAQERERLAPIASLVRIERGAILFRQGAEATAIYDIAGGVLKSVTLRPDGTRAILGFFFPQDIVGLAEDGRYVSTVQAVSSAVLYRMPLPALERLLRRDSELDHQFLMKACHELRAAQLHVLTLGIARADIRLARFLDLMRQIQAPEGARLAFIDLPMSRADIGEYLGLTPETVSRVFARLQRAQIIACPDPHHVRIVDEARFHAIAQEEARPRVPPSRLSAAG